MPPSHTRQRQSPHPDQPLSSAPSNVSLEFDKNLLDPLFPLLPLPLLFLVLKDHADHSGCTNASVKYAHSQRAADLRRNEGRYSLLTGTYKPSVSPYLSTHVSLYVCRGIYLSISPCPSVYLSRSGYLERERPANTIVSSTYVCVPTYTCMYSPLLSSTDPRRLWKCKAVGGLSGEVSACRSQEEVAAWTPVLTDDFTNIYMQFPYETPWPIDRKKEMLLKERALLGRDGRERRCYTSFPYPTSPES